MCKPKRYASNNFGILFTTLLFMLGADPKGVAAQNRRAPRPLSDTSQVSALLNMAKKKSQSNQPDSAEWYYKKAGKLAREVNDKEALMSFTSKYSSFLYNNLRYADALRVSRQQLHLALRFKDTKRTANAYNNMGLQYHALGNLKLAAEHIVRALKASENLDDPVDKQKFNTNLASVFLDLKDKKNSLFYARKGYELALTLRDPMQVARSLVNLSASEALNLQYQQSGVHMLEILSIARKYKDPFMEMHALVNLGDLENRKLNFTKALHFYKKAERTLRSAPDKDYEMYVGYGLANTYKNLKDYPAAHSYFQKVLPVAEKLMPKNDLREIYLLGADIGENLNQPATALYLWKKYSALSDSLLNASTQNAIHETEIKYQTSIKEKAIAQQKLELNSNQLELQKKNRWISISVMAILMLFAVSMIIYLVYRNKNQSIELSLLKAQIHPHFLFNTLNNLYALTLHKSDESPGVVLGLAEILRYILYECNTPSISLAKEMHMIERYIALEKIRYDHRLEINLNISHSAEEHEIAPLLILPLVENAFKHGISKMPDEGWINIDSRIRGNEYTFKISNNKTPDSQAATTPSRYGNIGLINIRKRLQILYPNKHSLRIIDEEGTFIVIMKLELR